MFRLIGGLYHYSGLAWLGRKFRYSTEQKIEAQDCDPIECDKGVGKSLKQPKRNKPDTDMYKNRHNGSTDPNTPDAGKLNEESDEKETKTPNKGYSHSVDTSISSEKPLTNQGIGAVGGGQEEPQDRVNVLHEEQSLPSNHSTATSPPICRPKRREKFRTRIPITSTEEHRMRLTYELYRIISKSDIRDVTTVTPVLTDGEGPTDAKTVKKFIIETGPNLSYFYGTNCARCDRANVCHIHCCQAKNAQQVNRMSSPYMDEEENHIKRTSGEGEDLFERLTDFETKVVDKIKHDVITVDRPTGDSSAPKVNIDEVTHVSKVSSKIETSKVTPDTEIIDTGTATPLPDTMMIVAPKLNSVRVSPANETRVVSKIDRGRVTPILSTKIVVPKIYKIVPDTKWNVASNIDTGRDSPDTTLEVASKIATDKVTSDTNVKIRPKLSETGRITPVEKFRVASKIDTGRITPNTKIKAVSKIDTGRTTPNTKVKVAPKIDAGRVTPDTKVKVAPKIDAGRVTPNTKIRVSSKIDRSRVKVAPTKDTSRVSPCIASKINTGRVTPYTKVKVASKIDAGRVTPDTKVKGAPKIDAGRVTPDTKVKVAPKIDAGRVTPNTKVKVASKIDAGRVTPDSKVKGAPKIDADRVTPNTKVKVASKLDAGRVTPDTKVKGASKIDAGRVTPKSKTKVEAALKINTTNTNVKVAPKIDSGRVTPNTKIKVASKVDTGRVTPDTKVKVASKIDTGRVTPDTKIKVASKIDTGRVTPDTKAKDASRFNTDRVSQMSNLASKIDTGRVTLVNKMNVTPTSKTKIGRTAVKNKRGDAAETTLSSSIMEGKRNETRCLNPLHLKPAVCGVVGKAKSSPNVANRGLWR